MIGHLGLYLEASLAVVPDVVRAIIAEALTRKEASTPEIATAEGLEKSSWRVCQTPRKSSKVAYSIISKIFLTAANKSSKYFSLWKQASASLEMAAMVRMQ
jgi:hypothetical protein